MLGTNNLKARFHQPAQDIAASIDILAGIIQSTDNWGRPAPKLLIVCPPPILEAGWLGAMFEGGVEKSKRLPQFYPGGRATAGRILPRCGNDRRIERDRRHPFRRERAQEARRGHRRRARGDGGLDPARHAGPGRRGAFSRGVIPDTARRAGPPIRDRPQEGAPLSGDGPGLASLGRDDGRGSAGMTGGGAAGMTTSKVSSRTRRGAERRAADPGPSSGKGTPSGTRSLLSLRSAGTTPYCVAGQLPSRSLFVKRLRVPI